MKTTKKKPFDNLTKAEKRVSIAKDVLFQLETNSVVPTSGNFVELFLEFQFGSDISEGKFFSELVADSNECRVCALGALMISQLNVNGDVSMSELDGSPICNNRFGITPFNGFKFGDYIKKYFDESQLQLIEIAYELGNGLFTEGDILCGVEDEIYSVYIESKAVKFGKRYKNLKNRMKAIMNNIIENNGEFAP